MKLTIVNLNIMKSNDKKIKKLEFKGMITIRKFRILYKVRQPGYGDVSKLFLNEIFVLR